MPKYNNYKASLKQQVASSLICRLREFVENLIMLNKKKHPSTYRKRIVLI